MTECKECKHFAEFKEPFRYDAPGYQEGVAVYGVCYKNCKNHISYPVYIPNTGTCRSFKKKPGVKTTGVDSQPLEMQRAIEGFQNA